MYSTKNEDRQKAFTNMIEQQISMQFTLHYANYMPTRYKLLQVNTNNAIFTVSTLLKTIQFKCVYV